MWYIDAVMHFLKAMRWWSIALMCTWIHWCSDDLKLGIYGILESLNYISSFRYHLPLHAPARFWFISHVSWSHVFFASQSISNLLHECAISHIFSISIQALFFQYHFLSKETLSYICNSYVIHLKHLQMY